MLSKRDEPLVRLSMLRLLVGIVVLLLAARTWHLQIVEGQSYRVLADRNRFRQVDVKAARGVIYDRDGEILARNQPSFTVTIVPADLPKDGEADEPGTAQAAILDRLIALIERPVPLLSGPEAEAGAAVSAEAPTPTPEPIPHALAIPERQPWIKPRLEIEQDIEEGMLGGAYRPIVIATHIHEATAFLIAEDAVNLPGVDLALEAIREYPSGALTAHVIGYPGHIPPDQVAEYEARGYTADKKVGLTGLEASFEDALRGDDGRQMIEVDVNGRQVRTVGEPDPAVPGHNLVLTLDLELQRAATEALRGVLDKSKGFTKATQGVAVALNPRNGAVLALVSLPSYDNNLFAKGITPEAWEALQTDPDLPLFNRAISGSFPPGSTFKIIVAAGGVEEGLLSVRTKLGDGFDGRNDGIIWLPNEYFPWDPSKAQPFYSWIHKYGTGHGFVTVREAIAFSDDIFFYQLGGGYRDIFPGLGSETIGWYAREFGLGESTGIDLPGESGGLVPTRKWKRITYAENWLTGDTYNMSIGQGFVLSTPLQMASATAAIANRGYLYRPQFVDQVTDAEGKVVLGFEPDLIREVPVDPAYLDIVREGMFGAINWPHGTAPDARIAEATVAGKTGTAEYYRDDNKDFQPDRDEKGNLPTHAWFTAFAPYVDPEIVVTVFVANGGEGSTVAVPVARQILQAYFRAETVPQSAVLP